MTGIGPTEVALTVPSPDSQRHRAGARRSNVVNPHRQRHAPVAHSRNEHDCPLVSNLARRGAIVNKTHLVNKVRAFAQRQPAEPAHRVRQSECGDNARSQGGPSSRLSPDESATSSTSTPVKSC